MSSLLPICVLAACSFLISRLVIAGPKRLPFVNRSAPAAVNNPQLLLPPNHLADNDTEKKSLHLNLETSANEVSHFVAVHSVDPAA